MEAKKIVIGCFVGGVLCVAVALMCAPMFWWLGLLAGMAGGYLGYEFREVLWAIPIAWRKSRRGVSNWWLNTDKKVREWSAKPHPYGYFYLAILLMVFLVLQITILFDISLSLQFTPQDMLLSFVISLALLVLSYLFSSMLWILLFAVSFLASNEDPKTTREFLGQIVKGAGIAVSFAVSFLLWKMWRYLVIGIWRLFCFLKRFGWKLFRLIHSKKRVLCAIDGTIGGTVAFFCFASASLTFPQQILVVFFGGLLGAVIGVLNYEIISKRVLHLVPAANNI